ncbi:MULTISPECIES: ImmA/IrrE family metallo-endopeptidase [unclassified Bradyrhizobium]|uniref:ImmA/IrrE family metallo-endopeptidase n=1 Tax=unclassified Bradyrhizobium TaxID=2631580 RepID=UPI0028EA46FE|nr:MULTISPECIES: ImmA/IrrE family metallo-endopeptidase [unclassified Bradyrhizobium]
MDDENDDRKVTRRSNDECRRIAERTKHYYGIGRTWPVNVGRILRSGKILTLRGERPLVYRVVPDHVLGSKDARTELIKGSVIITAKQSVDSTIIWGDRRTRMTMSHELGHGVMHAEEGTVDHRATGATGTTTISKMNASESAEHQAKIFASAFLIDDQRAAELANPTEIALEFLVSISAAEICFERLQAKREREAASARIMEGSKAFQTLVNKSKERNHYLQALCPSCRRQTLLPLATKVGCNGEGCGYIGDHPEDN